LNHFGLVDLNASASMLKKDNMQKPLSILPQDHLIIRSLDLSIIPPPHHSITP